MTDSATAAMAAYEALAPHYDFFTAGHDHTAWTASLEALVDRGGAPPGRLLDVACGSGNSFLPMLRRGWSVTACDVSPGMVNEAARKAPEVPLRVCDMRRLPVLGGFDLVWCLDDALNYLLDPGELVAAFAGMRRNLAPGGALLFDLNTLATYRGFFASDVVAGGDDRLVAWQGRTPRDAAPGCLAEATVTTFARAGGGWVRGRATHRQRHHPEAEVVRALAEAGLEPPEVFGHGLDGVPMPGADELHDTKAVYLTRAARRRARRKEVSRSDPHRAPGASRRVGRVRPEGQLTASAGRCRVMRRRLRPLVEVLEARDGSVYLLRGPAQGDLAIRALAEEDRATLRVLAAGRPAGGPGAAALLDALAAEDLLEPEPAPADRLASEERERFDRQLLYLRQVAAEPAEALQRRLRDARVVVLGCGGLGSWTAWPLACLGVGSLVLVDDDRVDATNLNRQLLFAAADVGRAKCDVARERLLAFDPALDVRAVRRRVRGPDDVAELVAGADVALGLADTPPYDIARWVDEGCARAGVPHLSAGQLPPIVRAGPFVVPGATPCLRCFERTLRGGTPLYDELETMRRAAPRPAATLGPACGLVGSILALDVLAYLTGVHEPATWGRALSIDMRTMEPTRVEVAADRGCGCALRAEVAAG